MRVFFSHSPLVHVYRNGWRFNRIIEHNGVSNVSQVHSIEKRLNYHHFLFHLTFVQNKNEEREKNDKNRYGYYYFFLSFTSNVYEHKVSCDSKVSISVCSLTFKFHSILFCSIAWHVHND